MRKSIRKTILIVVCICVVFLMNGCRNSNKPSNNNANVISEEKTTPAQTQTVTPSPELTPTPVTEPTSQIQDDRIITMDNLPVLDGATANLPFYQAVVGELLGISDEEAAKRVLCTTTEGAYANLTDGLADMIFVSYPSESQIKWAAEKKVEFEYHQILTGAFVFFVNKENPIDSLTLEQLQGIYSGKITNWKEVGGNDAPIDAYQRTEGSGSQNGLYRYILPKEQVMEAPKGYIYNTMSSILYAFNGKAYDNGLNAIGYSYYYYVANMNQNDSIKLIKINGIEPNQDTIANGTFPFCNPTLAVVRKGTQIDSPVYSIIQWILSDEGAELAKSLGYVVTRTVDVE